MTDQALQKLVDENDLCKLVIRMSIGMDERDYEMFRSCWADTVELDIPGMAEGEDPIGTGPADADAYCRGVIDMLSGFEATQHVSTNHLAEIDGDEAHCISYVLGTHFLRTENGDAFHTIGAKYDFTALRTSGGWKVTRMKWRKQWASGNAGLWQQAGKIVADRG